MMGYMNSPLKHQAAIDALFNGFLNEDWMTESDKKEAIELCLKLQDKTLTDLDHDIEIGVQNGYSVETQVKILQKALGNE